MFYDDNVILKNTTDGSSDEYGGYIPGVETTETFIADVQPFSHELMLKKYGYDMQVTRLMFCEPNENIKIGSIITFKDKDYLVVKIPWDDDHYEVVLDDV